MSFTWRMDVFIPSTGLIQSLSPSSSVVALNEFSVDVLGGSISGSFSGVPSALQIPARALVEISIGTPTLQPVFLGYVNSLPSVFSDDVGTYNLVGLKQRFYEVPIVGTASVDRLPASDIGAMVRTVLSSQSVASALPFFVLYSAGQVPDLGFSVGTRFPQAETLGDFLDSLARLAGRFVVPAGDTYTYDGVTYPAGTVIPEVRWGVNAVGIVFFKRAFGSTVPVLESDANVDVQWDALSVEDATNRVVLVYGQDYDLNFVESVFTFFGGSIPAGFEETNFSQPKPVPMTRDIVLDTATAGNLETDRVRIVEVQNPLDFCTRDTSFVIDTSATINWGNPGNVLDNNVLTFSQPLSASNSLVIGLNAFTGPKEAFAVIDYSSFFPVEFTVNYRSTAAGFLPPLSPVVNLRVVLPETDGQRTRAILFLGRPSEAPLSSVTFINLRFVDIATSTQINRINLFVPDVDLAANAEDTLSYQLAGTFERAIQPTAAKVKVFNFLPVARLVDLTPVGSSAVVLPVERVQYSVTTSEGVVTTFELGSAYDAELEVEKVLLERLARRAVKDGGARR